MFPPRSREHIDPIGLTQGKNSPAPTSAWIASRINAGKLRVGSEIDRLEDGHGQSLRNRGTGERVPHFLEWRG